MRERGSERDRVTRSRVVALQTLERIRDGDLADRALDALAAELSSRDRAWTQEAVYGTLRLRGRIDYLLDAVVRSGTASLEPDVLDVLRLGAYQLLEMGSVPAYAAISQSQELARAADVGRAAALVGGALHALERRKDQIRFPRFEADPLEHLATWGSHPRWLLQRWLDRWGPEDTRALVEANNRRPELYLRPLGMEVEQALHRLRDAGIAGKAVPLAPDSVRVLPPHGVREALAAVPAVVQDPAAALVVRYTAPPGGSRVLDVCAAPGGKALGLAERAAYVVAADVSFGRLERLRENAERVSGAGRLGLVVADARTPPFRPAETVLLDVPCTGTGTLRRHPDGRWRVTPWDLEQLVALQRELLDAVAELVRPGGWLVYSTCSLEPEENEDQVEQFLARRPDFAVHLPDAEIQGALLGEQGWLRLRPQRTGFDGSFAARLRRRP